LLVVVSVAEEIGENWPAEGAKNASQKIGDAIFPFELSIVERHQTAVGVYIFSGRRARLSDNQNFVQRKF
jgi:hypothetical protein